MNSHRSANSSNNREMSISYAGILLNILDERIRSNPSYSMRSFARDLNVAPSTLSEILKKKKGLSVKKASEIVKALRLPDWQASHFVNLVAVKHSRSKKEKAEAKASLEAQKDKIIVEKLKSDTMKALTSTLDLAILECVHLKKFDNTHAWIAKKLKVTLKEVKEAVERLIEVKLLEISADGEWRDLSPFFSSSDGISSDSIKAFNIDILKTMEKRIINEPVEDRIMKSVVFSLEEEHMKEARNILDEAIAKILNLSSKSDEKKDHIVCYSSQLFYLTKGEL